MFRKYKNQIFLLFLFSIIAVFSFLLETKSPNSPLDELNSRYGLISVESIATSENLIAFQPAGNLQANILGILAPEKEIIVKLKNRKEENELQEMFVLTLRSFEETEKIVKDYEKATIVEYAEKNRDIEIFNSESSTTIETGSGSETTYVPEEQNSDVIVAVIDSGIDTEHQDLQGNIASSWDFIDSQEKVTDTVGHGTHIAGIIAQYSHAKIMALKFTDQKKKGKLSNLIKAIKFATDHGARIINLSLGLAQESKALEEAIQYAIKKDIIVMASAGNNGAQTVLYPAAFPHVIAVSALGGNGEKLTISNFDKRIDFSAPGQNIYSAFPNNKHAYLSGTSQATAIVSALAVKAIEEKKNVHSYLEQISEPDKGAYEGLLGRKINASQFVVSEIQKE